MTDEQPPRQGQQLIKRTGTERAIEDSMRAWYAMRDERNEALARIEELEHALAQANVEKSVYMTRNMDLEHKYENLLIRFTQIQSALQSVGGLADTISLSVSEVLSLSRTGLAPPNGELPYTTQERHQRDDPSPTTSAPIGSALKALDELTQVLDAKDERKRAEEDTKLKDLARRLGPEPDPLTAERKAPTWLSSNSQSHKP
jgi:hypothetical protein